jgi:hypothetical protein
MSLKTVQSMTDNAYWGATDSGAAAAWPETPAGVAASEGTAAVSAAVASD